jgi:hypothetical protein
MDLKTSDKLVLCKIGYTYSMDKREKSICADFGCNLYPVGFLEINCEDDEKRFHRLLEDKYPQLPYVIDKKQKKSEKTSKKYEIYRLDPVLFEEFFKYNINLNTNTVLLEQEKQNKNKKRQNR